MELPEPQFLLIVRGSIMDEDGCYDTAYGEKELAENEQHWKSMRFSKVLVYEKISD